MGTIHWLGYFNFPAPGLSSRLPVESRHARDDADAAAALPKIQLGDATGRAIALPMRAASAEQKRLHMDDERHGAPVKVFFVLARKSNRTALIFVAATARVARLA
jgi:hypothetical protein